MKPKRTILFSDYTLPAPTKEQGKIAASIARASVKKPARQLSLHRQVLIQLPYIGRIYWLAMTAACFMVVFILLNTWQYFSITGMLPTLGVLACTGPLLAALGAPELAKSYAHSMWELEASAPLSLSRLTAVRLLATGAACLPVLAVVLLTVAGRGYFLLAASTLLTPFLLACAVCYTVLGFLKGVTGSLVCVGCCGLLCGCAFIVITILEEIRQPLPGWCFTALPLAALALSALLFTAAASLLVWRNNKTERMVHNGTTA